MGRISAQAVATAASCSVMAMRHTSSRRWPRERRHAGLLLEPRAPGYCDLARTGAAPIGTAALGRIATLSGSRPRYAPAAPSRMAGREPASAARPARLVRDTNRQAPRPQPDRNGDPLHIEPLGRSRTLRCIKFATRCVERALRSEPIAPQLTSRKLGDDRRVGRDLQAQRR